MKKKPASDSRVRTTEMVLPNDTNPLNNMMGGRVMHLMDVVAAISAQKHSGRIVVTASVDNISFRAPIALGDIVTLEAQVSRAFNSSMEVFIRVYSENHSKGSRVNTNEAFFTFVAVDQSGNPIAVPDVVPETKEEEKLYAGALQRRELRLVHAGRMKPEEATQLKNLFGIDPKGAE
jgi:acyl-CoA hydrolase